MCTQYFNHVFPDQQHHKTLDAVEILIGQFYEANYFLH
jgi:hypothetical protein